MYHPLLDTFITVADYGSFTKAAEALYISSTAVMKQMNTLESHLDLKLIERSPSGIRLTEAGSVIYRDAKFMIDYSQKAIASARAALCANDTTFCVGTSLLNPAKPFMDLWYRVNKDFPSTNCILYPLKTIMRVFFQKLKSWEKNSIFSSAYATRRNGLPAVIFCSWAYTGK